MLAGCAAASREVPFDVLADGQFARQRVDRVTLLVGADADGRARVAAATGASIPARRIALAVLAGERPTGGYAAKVQRVTRDGATLDVRVLITAPARGALVTQVITSPFAVVGVASADVPTGRVRFTLTDESGALLATVDADVR